MHDSNLIILSYHRFDAEENEYPFSRTYKQFANDLVIKDFDWITMDDGFKSVIKACEMMRVKNFRAKLFISTALIGTGKYLDWDDIWKLSRYHDIENHSHEHLLLTQLQEEEVYRHLALANALIKEFTGRCPRYFVAPWNTYNDIVLKVAAEVGLQVVRGRVDIRNNSR